MGFSFCFLKYPIAAHSVNFFFSLKTWAVCDAVVYSQMFADDGECDVGEACDVWGIGCIMYHMIVGVSIHDSFRHEPHSEIPIKVRFCVHFGIFWYRLNWAEIIVWLSDCSWNLTWCDVGIFYNCSERFTLLTFCNNSQHCKYSAVTKQTIKIP